MNPEDKSKLGVLRGIVRPSIALAAMFTLIGLAAYMAITMQDRDIALLIIGGFMTLTAVLTGRFFKSREEKEK